MDGQSLVPTLQDVQTGVHQAAVSQYFRKLGDSRYMGYSIRTASHRLVEWRDFATGEVTERELYDHRSEHSETENIIDSASPELVEEITKLLLINHPRRGLVMTPKIHADAAQRDSLAKISFSNERDGQITVTTINSVGKRVKKRPLMPGKTLKIRAHTGAVFVVESADGKVHEIHSPSVPEETIVVK